MPKTSLVILYVDSAPKAADFYSSLLSIPVGDSSPGFATLPIGGEMLLGLWTRANVDQPPTATEGSGELCLTVDDADAVAATHADWVARGISIIAAPYTAEFGRNFLAADEDGNRIRVLFPAG